MGKQLTLFKVKKRRTKDYSFTSRPSDIFPSGCFELSVGYKRKAEKRQKITDSQSAADFARKFCYPEGVIEHCEHFYIILCDRANQAFAFRRISEGGVAGTVVDARLVYQICLLCHASAVALVHNHPSGSLQPSEHDIRLTKRMVEAGKLLEITVLDHVILTSESHYSFADEGIL